MSRRRSSQIHDDRCLAIGRWIRPCFDCPWHFNNIEWVGGQRAPVLLRSCGETPGSLFASGSIAADVGMRWAMLSDAI